jgi:dGTPase
MVNDLKNFEGNAQSIRIVTKLHNLIDLNGMNLTKGLLCTLIKYPCNSTEIKKDTAIIYKKMGYFYAERETFDDITGSTGIEHCRHPLTFLLEAADDIAYLTADIEDATKKGIMTVDKILSESKAFIQDYNGHETEIKYLVEAVDKLNSLYYKNMDKDDPQMFAMQNWIIYVQGLLIRSAVFSFTKNYSDIMNGDHQTDLFDGTFGKGLAKFLQNLAVNNIFNNIQIQKLEIAAEKILGSLLDIFIPAVVKYDADIKMSGFEKRVINLISKSHMSVYKESAAGCNEREKLYLRLLMITDFISGMTDSYAKNLYRELNGFD